MVTAVTGEPIGDASVEFVQATWQVDFSFNAIPAVWGRLGVSPVIQALVTLSFEDIDETKWVREPTGRLLHYRRLRRHRSDGHRHATDPRSKP